MRNEKRQREERVSMGVLGLWYAMVISLSVLFASGAQASENPYKVALKQCRAEFKVCKKSGERKKVCRKQFRVCKDENDVQLKDRLKRFKEKLSAAIDIEIKKDEEHGEYLKLDIKAKALKHVPEFKQALPQMESYVQVAEEEGNKEFSIALYNKDLGSKGGEKLQISEGRSFPKFINGVKFDDLFGKQFKVGNVKNFQVYYDVDHQVAGAFMPAKVAGNLIQILNVAKDSVIDWLKGYIGMGGIPVELKDINSIPVNLKMNGEKVGRISILSKDQNGKNSGVVVLVDLEKARELAKQN